MKFKTLVESVLNKDEIVEEGFFGDMKAIWKLTKDVAKYTEEAKKKGKPKNTDGGVMFYLTFWEEHIEKVEEIIRKSNLSAEMKDTFYNGAIGTMYGEMYSGSGMSGGDIQKALGWSNERYNRLSKAYQASKK